MIKQHFTRWLNKRQLDKYAQEVKHIREIIDCIKDLTNEELVEKFRTLESDNIRSIYAIGTILIERLTDLRLHNVQLIGALALNDNKIAEMKTGEGKTITSVLPILAKALKGQVHVCTVNEYLAQRDKEYLEPIYKLLGFTVSLNLQSDSRQYKREHYKADIVYGTASTFGFDYLNDNTVKELDHKVCSRERYYALVDEVDLVLIDEARTPLIIGASEKGEIELIKQVQSIVSKLVKNEDFTLDKQNFTVKLTPKGITKLELGFNVENIHDKEYINLLHLIHQSLLANFMYKENIDYAITYDDNNEKVITIIDTFTGRLQEGRRFSQGLHQAIEAKHPFVQVRQETKTSATITLQNYFKLYKSIAGMSGTSHEERDEFKSVYGLDVLEVPTNVPMQREDKQPILVPTKKEKWEIVCNKIKEYHKLGYPILVGTVSVRDSYHLSELLGNKYKIKHTVLNATQDKEEAKIVEKAGLINAVTIATNMAGRGTDIRTESLEHPLVVFVTELNESSRIDNQLKGRTSRQGALGIVETILSAEDFIFHRSHQMKKMANLGKQYNQQKMIAKITRYLQNELEGASSSARQNSLKYDDVIKDQRNIFYQTRDKILSAEDLSQLIDKLTLSLNCSKEQAETINKLKEMSIKSAKEILLFALDTYWIDHIDRLETLKSAIGWRAQSGHNPIIIYQNEAQILYHEFLENSKLYLVELLTEKGERHNEMA